MNEEQLCRLLEVLVERKLITGYDSEYIQEKRTYSEWKRFCCQYDWKIFADRGSEE